MKYKEKEVTIIDYGMGNILSVVNALSFLGYKSLVTSDVKIISKSKYLILPGVGAYNKAMNILSNKKIDLAIKDNIKKNEGKILGICLGMQLLAKKGFEGGEIKGLGLIDGEVKKLNFDKKNKFKVPHVGFNKVVFPKKNLLYRNLEKKKFFLFYTFLYFEV